MENRTSLLAVMEDNLRLMGKQCQLLDAIKAGLSDCHCEKLIRDTIAVCVENHKMGMRVLERLRR